MIYVTGDVHGEPIKRFSFAQNAGLRRLDSKDVMIILGDFGVPFGVDAPYSNDEDVYSLKWMTNQKYTYIAIAGNHDDRNAIEDMPIVDRYGGQMRQMSYENIVYPNIYYVDTPQILDICGEHCLIIPGAESRDIDDGILDPAYKHYKMQKKKLVRENKLFFRTKGWDWWENEKINIEQCKLLLKNRSNEHFDYIFSHDYPSIACKEYYRNLPPTEGEEYLESLRQTLDFDAWMFGHAHTDLKRYEEDNRLLCLYYSIVKTGGL